MIPVCRHGQPLCEHGNCGAWCNDCALDFWFFGELEDALDRWADDGGHVP
jgi:hypothetical protein